MSDVKLSVLVQKRSLNIFLKYKSSRLAISIFFLAPQPMSNIIQPRTHRNPITPIGILPRLTNPNIPKIFINFLTILEFPVMF